MASSVILRILVGGPEDSRKLVLESGIPTSVDELHSVIRTRFGFFQEFRLQYMDPDFDNEYMNLTSTTDIKDKSTIRLILSNEATMTLIPVSPNDEDAVFLSPERLIQISDDARSLSSYESNDGTIILSSESSSASPTISSRTSSWPEPFVTPCFSYDAEIQLQRGNSEFAENGTCLNVSYKLKSTILDGIAEEILKYTAYPNDSQFDKAAAALIAAHPCLKELGSTTGYWGWKHSLKVKMANYRTKLGQLGCPEVSVNLLKHKRPGQAKAAANVKKPRKAEVNYVPCHPKGVTIESLEDDRVSLLTDITKRNSETIIKEKMERTFSYRREEVVKEKPAISEFKRRWPALFYVNEVNAEFKRITTVPLQSKFLGQLDRYSSDFKKIFLSTKGAAGRMIKSILDITDKCDDIHIKREGILKSLCVCLKEDYTQLVKEYLTCNLAEAEMEKAQTVLGIYVVRKEGVGSDEEPEDVGIVIEGVEVLNSLGSVAIAWAMLFGLIYTLDLTYPNTLRYTFEVFQKILMGLDGQSLSKKVQKLKIKMFL